MKRAAAALMALTAIGVPAVVDAAKGGNHDGGGSPSGIITVGDTVHGGTTTATVNPGGEDVYVFVKCHTPDLGGPLVYAAYFEVDVNNQATVGPLWSTLWTSGEAACVAEEGYFRRSGFGKWVTVASTTFQVAAS